MRNRPLWLNFTSEMEEIISEKKERLLGSSGSSKTTGCKRNHINETWLGVLGTSNEKSIQELLKKLTLAVAVTECSCSHVTQSYGALATAIDKHITMVGMKLCCGDHFSELFHVGWFYIYNVCRVGEGTRTKNTALCANVAKQFQLISILVLLKYCTF